MTLWQRIKCFLRLADRRKVGYRVTHLDKDYGAVVIGQYAVASSQDALDRAHMKMMSDFLLSDSVGALSLNLRAEALYEYVERAGPRGRSRPAL